jgi:hypothetical protein
VRNEYVSRFNSGVRSGDWSSLLELLADDCELEFVGIPVGPFAGRDAIAAAYEAQPPDDEIVLLDGGPAYAWAREPDVRAGELLLAELDRRIAKITVVYER